MSGLVGKMLTVFYSLLMLGVGRSTDELIFETKTVAVGEDVKLACSRQTSEFEGNMYWIRLVSGSMPEFLGGTFSFDYDDVKKTPYITLKQEPGTFIVQIHKARLSDIGIYYCIKVDALNLTFLKGILLKIEAQSTIAAIIQDPLPDPVRPGDPVTLQCSVLSDTERKTCSAGNRVYWFRSGSDESHLSLIYPHDNSSDECDRSRETDSEQKCVYSFSKNVSSSDGGTYYCAVATCGEILFGNGTKVNIEALNMWRLQVAVIVLSVSLTVSVVVISILTFTIKKNACNSPQNCVTTSGDHRSQQRNEVSLVYSAPTFTKRKSDKTERRNTQTPAVYSPVTPSQEQ